jgi:hypothetical protein
MFSTVGVCHVIGEEMERDLAATPSTRITLGTAVDTASHAASGLMQSVHALATVIENVEFRDTERWTVRTAEEDN